MNQKLEKIYIPSTEIFKVRSELPAMLNVGNEHSSKQYCSIPMRVYIEIHQVF